MSLKYRFIIFILTSGWAAGIFIFILAPYKESLMTVGLFLKKTYSLVCHQDPSKLICINSLCTLVCARCTGIYTGAFLISSITLFIPHITSPKIYFLYISAVLIILDIISYNSGFYNYNIYVAFITGSFSGSIAFLYIRSGIEKLIIELK